MWWVVEKVYPNALAPDRILVSNLLFPSTVWNTAGKKYETPSDDDEPNDFN